MPAEATKIFLAPMPIEIMCSGSMVILWRLTIDEQGDDMINAYAASEAGAELKPFEYDPGPIGHHEVEIEVEHCGICHSDINMLDDDWGMTQYPLVPDTRWPAPSPRWETRSGAFSLASGSVWAGIRATA